MPTYGPPRVSAKTTMSKANIVKIAALADNQGSKRKHRTDGERPPDSRKRLKEGQLRLQDDDRLKDFDNFKFLHLPPEVRNQIYAYATEQTHRCFPLLHGNPKKTTRRRVLRSGNSTETPGPDRKPIPYLGLTQVCLQIRAEFRPMWLSTHRIPFNFLQSYFKTFFVARAPKMTRSNVFGLSVSEFRIWVRKDDLGQVWDGCEATRLFKHKARFPKCVVICQSMPQTEESTLRQLEKLINHDHPDWRRAVTAGRISQVRLSLQDDRTTPLMHIVVKERYAEPWMKVISVTPSWDIMEGYLRRFGFEYKVGWEARVSVDYS